MSKWIRCLTVCLHRGHSTQQPWGRRRGDSWWDSSAPGNPRCSVQSPSLWGGSRGQHSPCQWPGKSKKEQKELKIKVSEVSPSLGQPSSWKPANPPKQKLMVPADHNYHLCARQQPHEDFFAFLPSNPCNVLWIITFIWRTHTGAPTLLGPNYVDGVWPGCKPSSLWRWMLSRKAVFPPLRNVEFGRRKTVPLIKCNGVFHMRLNSRFDSVNFFL